MTNPLAHLVDIDKLDKELLEIREKRDELKREQLRLRVQEHRLKKLRKEINDAN